MREENEDFNLLEVVIDEKLIQSRAEYRRLITQGAVKVNDIVITELYTKLYKGDVITIGINKTIIVGEE